MSRLDDLRRFYDLMDTLQQRCGGPRTLQSCDGRMGWPERGVYFFFEPGEDRTSSGNGPRVVRVGTHAVTKRSRTTLWNRLSQHRGGRGGKRPGGGNHRGSIFRLHVGSALIGRGERFRSGAASWGQGSTGTPEAREHEYPIEQAVSAHIGAMPFLWLDVPDLPGRATLRGVVERNAIALLSNFHRPALDPASAAWLGHHADRDAVRDSHLWNVNHVGEDHDPEFLDILARLIDVEPDTASPTMRPYSARDRASSDSDGFAVSDVVAGYTRDAGELVGPYESLSFKEVHEPVLDLLPESAGCILDVGAGTGRDAAWFAERGHDVIAVEPVEPLRAAAKQCHVSTRIRWLDDTLPALEKVVRSKLAFDLIWLSAVWMHIPASVRPRAFRKLVSMLRPGGSIMVSIRQGPPPIGRPMEPATVAELETLARRHGLLSMRVSNEPDVAGRAGVSWERIWLRLPDDGTGALPLLRHIIFNDRKASTYKLALLRVLLRIADGAAGLARETRDEQHVELPLGLVALFWVRAFRPLIATGLPQHPSGNTRLGFVKDGFRGLGSRSPNDLRIGQRFTGDDAGNLIRAVRDAAKCIRTMPAKFITYPGGATPVFPSAAGRSVRVTDVVRLDEAFLWSIGTLAVPTHLWQAMTRYAPWLEPAILSEWVQIMRGYEASPSPWDLHMEALRWLDPEHDTAFVRALGERLRTQGTPLFCMWTGRRLREGFDIDHCFPFAAWPCNDLWNLLPSSPATNRTKGDRLPAPEALENARPRLLEWWDRAYLRDSALSERFADESRSALPMAAASGNAVAPESLFEAVMIQQAVLKRDQQLSEWSP